MKFAAATFFAVFLAAFSALAQPGPGPPPACPVSGCTFTGEISTSASTSSGTGFNISPGSAPVSPFNGDAWVTNSGFYIWINGALVGPLLGTNALGTGILAALVTNVGSAGAPVLYGGAGGTPSSIGLANGTGLPTTGLTGSITAAQMLALATGDIYQGNGSNQAAAVTFSAAINAGIGSTRGSILESGASGWTLVTPGTAGTVLTSNGAGADPGYALASLVIPSIPSGRLTLASGTPVMTTTVSGATTIYWTPYNGATMWFYNGTNWTAQLCAETTNATAQSSTGNAGPAAVTTNSNYDLFMWPNSGACTLTRGPLWTNNTTRGAGSTLVLQNGIYLNNASITNGPAASRGTYVGTVHSNGTSTIDYIFGASASGGTAASLQVWNEFNRVSTPTTVTDSGTSYTYNSATIRQARGSAGNQIGFVIGVQEDGVTASYLSNITTPATLDVFFAVGLGLDTATAYTITPSVWTNTAAQIDNYSPSGTGTFAPGIGAHVISLNQSSQGSVNNVFDSASADYLSAIIRN